MTVVNGILGQAALAATTLTDVVSITGMKQARARAILVCNRDSAGTTFRIAFAERGAAADNKQYTHYDVPIGGNDSFLIEADLPLGPGDVIRAYAGAATVSVTVLGEKEYN